MSVTIITKDNFQSEVMESKIPVLLDFYADWCGPCKMVSPIVENISKENDNVKVVKINVDNEPSIAQSFGVSSIPTLLVIKNGKVTNKAVGYRGKNEILAMI